MPGRHKLATSRLSWLAIIPTCLAKIGIVVPARGCNMCGDVKPVDEFPWNNRALGKLMPMCQPCNAVRMHQLRPGPADPRARLPPMRGRGSYRDPAPTVQLLHCLRAAGEGGDTGLVDGFAAAADFRAADPESFGTLARKPVSFGYVDKETELRASLPLIQLSPSGRVRGVHFNNRSMQPLRRSYAEVTAFYAAYRRWAELLALPCRAGR